MSPRHLLLFTLTLLIALWHPALAQEEPPEPPASPLLAEAQYTLSTADGTFVALGNSVVRLDPATGTASWRKAVSGRVTLLEESTGGISVVTELSGGLSERISLDLQGRASTQVNFGTDPAVLAGLRDEAGVADPQARLEADPTNPWLYLAVAQQVPDEEAEAALLESAVATAGTFYDLAGLAGALAEQGHYPLADQAMQAALQDFARRGYDPHLLTDPEMHAAYGFPVPRLQLALQSDDAEAAAFWARWSEAFLSPNAPWVASNLQTYADWLAGHGETALAAQLRERTQPSLATVGATGMERLFLSLGRSGWYMFASLVVVILALQITLTFKYWEPQGLAMRRTRETGGSAGFLQRFMAIRFFSTTEKLVLALLYVAGLGILGLTGWADRASGPPAAVSAGTLASAEAQDALADLNLTGERGQFIQGYAAQLSGDSVSAELHYRAAPRYGPALNNLAVLTGDDALLEEAARLVPALPQVRWNQGDASSQPVFDHVAGLQRPALVAPGPLDFRTAQRGDWQQAATSFFRQPVDAFRLRVDWLAAHWLWYALLGLYLLLGALTLLWIIVPRPRMARNAPRSPAYHVLALLVPGSGMADEVWGVLLLIPWGLFGVDLAWRLAGAGPLLDLGLNVVVITLAILYALNLAAFLVEFNSYRRRMRRLFRTSPEAGIAYGRQIEPG